MAKEGVSERRFVVYTEEEWKKKNGVSSGGFKTYDEAKEFAKTLGVPTTIHFAGAGIALKRTKEDFEFKTDSGKTILMKWEKNEFRAYRKDGRDLIDLKLGATIPDALIDYINKNM